LKLSALFVARFEPLDDQSRFRKNQIAVAFDFAGRGEMRVWTQKKASASAAKACFDGTK
jgi:hypothetical protein